MSHDFSGENRISTHGILMRIGLSAIIAFCVVLSSCTLTPVEQGDAISTGSGGFRSTKLPVFPIGKPGVHEFRVSGLKDRQFPYSMRYFTQRSTGSDWYVATPFEDSVIRVEVLSNSGKVLAKTVVRPKTWRFAREGEFEKIFWSPREPNLDFLSSYRVRVTVLVPSDREWDKARLLLR